MDKQTIDITLGLMKEVGLDRKMSGLDKKHRVIEDVMAIKEEVDEFTLSHFIDTIIKVEKKYHVINTVSRNILKCCK